MNFRKITLSVFVLSLFLCATSSWAQSSGSIEGVVKDSSGGVLSNATVEISNPVTGFHRETTTGSGGDFRITNLPFNPYRVAVTAKGFSTYTHDVDVRSVVPTTLDVSLKLGTTSENITVEATGAELLETESTPHTDVDRELFDKLPLESQSSQRWDLAAPELPPLEGRMYAVAFDMDIEALRATSEALAWMTTVSPCRSAFTSTLRSPGGWT